MKAVFNTYSKLPLEKIYEAAQNIITEQYPKGSVSFQDSKVCYTTHSGKGQWIFEEYKLTFSGYRNSFIEGCDLCYVAQRGRYQQITLFILSLNFYTDLDPVLIETSTPDVKIDLFNDYIWNNHAQEGGAK